MLCGLQAAYLLLYYLIWLAPSRLLFRARLKIPGMIRLIMMTYSGL